MLVRVWTTFSLTSGKFLQIVTAFFSTILSLNIFSSAGLTARRSKYVCIAPTASSVRFSPTPVKKNNTSIYFVDLSKHAMTHS